MFQESERIRVLVNAATTGDLQAGKDLLKATRRNMCIPDWEKPPKVTPEMIEKLLYRRSRKMSGKLV